MLDISSRRFTGREEILFIARCPDLFLDPRRAIFASISVRNGRERSDCEGHHVANGLRAKGQVPTETLARSGYLWAKVNRQKPCNLAVSTKIRGFGAKSADLGGYGHNAQPLMVNFCPEVARSR